MNPSNPVGSQLITAQRASRVAKRLRRALSRSKTTHDRIKLRIRKSDLEALAATAEHLVEYVKRVHRLERPIGTNEVARILRCSPTHVLKLVSQGVLPCQVRPSGHRRYKLIDVETLL